MSETRQTNDDVNLYEAANFFMLRAPVLSITKDFKDLSEQNLIPVLREYVKSPYIKEAIAVASLSLYRSLDKLDGDPGSKKTRNAASALIKFLIRMSSRPTPFGLFAGVEIGTFHNETKGSFKDQYRYKKRTRPDMEWLLGIVNLAENNFDIIKYLNVKANNATYVTGNRIHLSYYSSCGQLRNQQNSDRKENISIRNTIVVQDVLKIAATPINLEKLIKSINEKYDQATWTQIRTLIWKLCREEFLISELRPPFSSSLPLSYIINVLRKAPTANLLVDELEQIQSMITSYDNLVIGDGLSLYLEINKRMKALNQSSSMLQVDLKRISAEQPAINQSIQKDIGEAAEWLWKLSDRKIGMGHLREYHLDFLEKYGVNRTVPLIELLSEEKGLGPPPDYKHPKGIKTIKKSPQNSQTNKDIFLLEKYTQCLRENKVEIELTKNERERLYDRETADIFAPNSGELFAEILSPSPEEMDNGNYYIAIGTNVASQEIGQTFGRFTDMISPYDREALAEEQSIVEQQCLDASVEVVEASYLPEYGRSGNVAITDSRRKYHFALGTNTPEQTILIEPNDIYVGATLNRLYLKSKKLNKRLIVTADNMLNYEHSPNSYRFLREVSMEDTKPIQPFKWGSLEGFSFLPRVKSGRIILSPAIWKLNHNHQSIADHSLPFKKWSVLFHEWQLRMKVPRFVHLTFGDNRLFVDLQNTAHLQELRGELRKKGRIQLREITADYIDNHWLESERGYHSTEIVVPFKKTKSVPKKPQVNLNTFSSIPLTEIEKEPGTEWLYFIIYMPSHRQDEVISHDISELIEELQQSEMINSWFFIRYHDHAPHVRLRLKGEPNTLLAEVMPVFYKWAKRKKENGKVRSFTINVYEREIERYGGLALMEDMENYFEIDSMLTSKILELKRKDELLYPLEVITSLNILYFLQEFGWDYQKQLSWIKNGTDKYDFSDEFRPLRKNLLKLADAADNWKALREYSTSWFQLLERTNKPIKCLSQKINTEEITNTPEKIAGSLIHMHCNRLIGTNRELEKKTMAFVRHILESQRYWKEKEVGPHVYSRST
ncbi:lantibiotic dehydratase [Alteribacillus sp. HJP-4]|uniref:lantibiotic dehydratase n=1 Tax=Alteribacillus sp. HJP-4 TaxID=2775394 RepID=UPI0035CCDA41